MTVARYAYGVAALVILACGLTITATALRRRLAPEASDPLASLVIGLFVLLIVAELLGSAGLLRLGPLLAATSVLALTARLTCPRGGSAPQRSRLGGARGAAALALLGAGAVAAEWTAPTLASFDTGIRSFDSLWYHLPWAASFAQTGNVAALRFTDVEYLTQFYPASGELLHGVGIVLLGRDTLSPALNLAFLAGTLLAAWCAGRAAGAAPPAMLGAALALGLPMARYSQGGSAANDVIGTFFLIAAVAFVLEGDAAWLAALAAGLAISVKLSLVAPALAVALCALAGDHPRRRDRRLAPWLAALVIAGGYWYARNLIAVGNPLPWLSLGPFATPSAPLQQDTGFSIAHYLIHGGGWSRYFLPGLQGGLGPWWPAVIAAAVLGPLACLLSCRGRTQRLLAGAALLALAAYLVTPETAAGPAGQPSGFAFNLRYALPALTLALTAGALAAGRAGPRLRAALLAIPSALLVAELAQSRLWPSGYAATAVAAVAALAVTAGLLALLLARGRRGVATGLAIAVALTVAVSGYAGQRHYLTGRYRYIAHVSSMSGVWQWFRSVHGARVALAGTFGGFFSYPLYGLDLSNRVQYVAAHGPHGSFTPIATCRAWRLALDQGNYRYVVTTPARDPWRPQRLTASPEAAWTASDPAARPVLQTPARDQRIIVFELHGHPRPDLCAG